MESYADGQHGYHGHRFSRDRSRSPHAGYERQSDYPRSSDTTDQGRYFGPEGRDLDYDGTADYRYPAGTRHRTPPREHFSSGYQDRDDEKYRSPPRHQYNRSHSRSRSPRRRDRARSPLQSGLPNRDVIMEGLPPTMDEKDIKSELEQYYEVHGLRDVRVIKDRKTGHSRGFGFLQFRDLQAAQTFVERHQPEIQLQGKESRASYIAIAYSRQREDREPVIEEDWICSNCTNSNYARRLECYKCQASKARYNAGPPEVMQIRNTGDSDVSPDVTPSQFLLFRGLEASVTEELLAKGAAKLYKISDEQSQHNDDKPKIVSTTATSNFGATEGSIKRVFVVRDRASEDTWKYGFIEYHSAEDAQAAYSKFNAMDRFTIASRLIMVSYIHAGVFIPAHRDDDLKYSFAASGSSSLRLSYWDQKAFLSEYGVSDGPPDTIVKAAPGSGMMIDAIATEGLLKDSKNKKRKADTTSTAATKKTMPSHLQFWKNRHDELHGNQKTVSDQPGVADKPGGKVQGGKTSTPQSTNPPSQSFADPVKNCCYLCSRQFKSTAEVNKHERLSQLHRDNLAKDELKQKALQKLIKAGVKIEQESSGSNAPDAQDSQEYRDRAKERRAVHGQPKKPSNNIVQGAGSRKAQPDGDDEVEQAATKKTPSKGASLLGKMGWTAGQGLGAQGTGSVAPIAQDVYAEGVGLGAAGSKLGDAVEEADRRTKGDYGAFLAKTKDMARDRWQAMSKDG